MTHGFATKGHCFMCASCGYHSDYIGMVISHIRNVHKRKLSAPEFNQVTTRQMRDHVAWLRTQT